MADMVNTPPFYRFVLLSYLFLIIKGCIICGGWLGGPSLVYSKPPHMIKVIRSCNGLREWRNYWEFFFFIVNVCKLDVDLQGRHCSRLSSVACPLFISPPPPSRSLHHTFSQSTVFAFSVSQSLIFHSCQVPFRLSQNSNKQIPLYLWSFLACVATSAVLGPQKWDLLNACCLLIVRPWMTLAFQSRFSTQNYLPANGSQGVKKKHFKEARQAQF